jgi:hypothetical protein
MRTEHKPINPVLVGHVKHNPSDFLERLHIFPAKQKRKILERYLTPAISDTSARNQFSCNCWLRQLHYFLNAH